VVDVAAPGCHQTVGLNGFIGSFCGTSSATPGRCGILGLARAAAPNAAGSDLETAVRTTAVPTGADVAYGRVDAQQTLAALGARPPATPTEPEPGTSEPQPAPPPTTTTFSGSFNQKTTIRTHGISSAEGF
jgi:hypothetical protein